MSRSGLIHNRLIECIHNGEVEKKVIISKLKPKGMQEPGHSNRIFSVKFDENSKVIYFHLFFFKCALNRDYFFIKN